MIDKEEAMRIAITEIAKLKDDTLFLLLEDQTEEKQSGWVFHYTTKEYHETGDEANLIPGMVPIYVNRLDGSFKFITVFDEID
jgi:hypothetical protein